MSYQITAAQVDQFSANVEHLVQQQDCRFAGKVRTESQNGKKKFYEQLGSTTAVKRTTRHGDTPRVDSKHRRREVSLTDYDWSDLVDSLDQIKMLISPTSPYAQSAAMAFNRAKDVEVIEAATGTAYADTTGSGTVSATTLPSTQQVDVNYVPPGGTTANSGLTLGKLIEAKSILGKNEYPRGDRIVFVHTQQQLDDLLNNVTQVSSADYAAVKALQVGDVSGFMGMEFLKTQLLTLNVSTDVRTCFAYASSGLLMAVGQDARGRISERDDKNYATQVYYNMSVGATRMQEELVVEVSCDESI
jgi:hypothetical protein